MPLCGPTTRRWTAGHLTAQVLVRFSHKSNPKPYYLQRAMNNPKIGYYGVHLIFNEEFATIEEAFARAGELMSK